MPPKVQIFLSEQAKKNANAPKKLGKNAGRPKIQLKSPARNASAAKNAKPKGKVVKSAARPIQKMSNVKIVQPTKGAMQPGSSENKPKSPKTQGQTRPKSQPQQQPQKNILPVVPEKQGKGRGPKNQGLKSASSSSDMNMNHNQQGETSMSQAVKHAIAISTAQVIAANNNHPRQREIFDLLATLQKGWIDQKKFSELLKGMLF